MLPNIKTQATCAKFNIFFFQLAVKTKNKKNLTTLHQFKELQTCHLLTLINQKTIHGLFLRFFSKILPLFAQIIENNQYSSLKAFMFYVPSKQAKQRKHVRRKRFFFFSTKAAKPELAKQQLSAAASYSFWARTYNKLREGRSDKKLVYAASGQQLRVAGYSRLVSKLSLYKRAKFSKKIPRSRYVSKLLFYRKTYKAAEHKFKNLRARALNLSTWALRKAARRKFRKSETRVKTGNLLKIELATPKKRSAHEAVRIIRSVRLSRKQSINLKWARRVKKARRKNAKLRALLKKSTKKARKFYTRNYKSEMLVQPTWSSKRAESLQGFTDWTEKGPRQKTVEKKRSLFAMMHEERERLKKENPKNVFITYASPLEFDASNYLNYKKATPFSDFLRKTQQFKTCFADKQKRTLGRQIKFTPKLYKREASQLHTKAGFSVYTKTTKKHWSVSVRYAILSTAARFYKKSSQSLTSTYALLRKKHVLRFFTNNNNSHTKINQVKQLLAVFTRGLARNTNYKQLILNILIYLTQHKTVNFIFFKKRKYLYQMFFFWFTNISRFFKFKVKNTSMFKLKKKLKHFSAEKAQQYTNFKAARKSRMSYMVRIKKAAPTLAHVRELVKIGQKLDIRWEELPNMQTPVRLNHALLLHFSKVSAQYRRKLRQFRIGLKKPGRNNYKILQKLKKKIKRNKRYSQYAKQRKSLARVNKTHKDRRSVKEAVKVLVYKLHRAVYTKALPALRKKKTVEKQPLAIKHKKVFKKKNLSSGYTPQLLKKAAYRRKKVFVSRVKGRSVRLKSKLFAFKRELSKRTQLIASTWCKVSLLSTLTTKKLSMASIRYKPQTWVVMPGLLQKPRLLKYLKKFLKTTRRKNNTYRSRIKALYFKAMRRPTYRRLARRPWKIQWKRLTKNLKKNNFKLKKHLLRSMYKAVRRSHFFFDSEKLESSEFKALKYGYVLSSVQSSLVINQGKNSLELKKIQTGHSLPAVTRSLPISGKAKPSLLTRTVQLTSSEVAVHNNLGGALSPRLVSNVKNRLYAELGATFSFPLTVLKKSTVRKNHTIPLVRNPFVPVHPQKSTFTLGFRLKLKPATPGKYKKKVLFSLVINSGKNNRVRRQLRQLKLYNAKFKFLNLFAIDSFTYKQGNYSFEQFLQYRIKSRGWPKHANTNLRDKKKSTRLKNRINLINVIKQGYMHNPSISSKNKIILPDISKNSRAYKFLDKKRTTKIAQIDKQFSQEKVLSNRNNLHDLSRHFLKVLWKVQASFRSTIRKGTSLNRWRFKKKFWEWFKKSRASRIYQASASMGFPSLETLLTKLGVVSTHAAFANLLRIGLVKLNKAGFNLSNANPTIGDYVTLPAFTTFVTKAEKTHLQFAKRKLKQTQQKHQLIVTSQWRQKKTVRPNVHKLFQRFKYTSVPSWLEFDMFVSCFAFIKYPQNLMYRKDDTQANPALLKLTPWRLKV